MATMAAEPGARRPTLTDIERKAIEERLAELDFHLGRTAESLGISRTTLWRRIRTYGLAGWARRGAFGRPK